MSNDSRLGMVLGIGLVLALGLMLPRKEAVSGSDESASPASRVSGAPRQPSQTLTPVRPTLRTQSAGEE